MCGRHSRNAHALKHKFLYVPGFYRLPTVLKGGTLTLH